MTFIWLSSDLKIKSELIKQSWGMERERGKESMDGKRNQFLIMP